MSVSSVPSQVDNDTTASSGAKLPSQDDQEVRQGIHKIFDSQICKISYDEDKMDVLNTIQTFGIYFIKEALQKPAESEEGLILLWHMFLEAAKVLDRNDVHQQKLVSLLLWTKEYDAQRRSLHPTENTSTMWEYYHFADSVQKSWEQLLMTRGSVSQHCNLAAFSSTALAYGICQDSLGFTALWLLREALETDGETCLTLLSAAVVWIETCRHKLLTFSANNKSYEDHPKAHLLASGALARMADIDQTGFSLERWVFWRRRFQELSRSTNPIVAKEAKEGFMVMISCGRELDFDVPGEAKFKAAMENALVESGRDSVNGDEIDLNVDLY